MSLDDLLAAMKAAAESTRLRLLALLAKGELTVSELTQIMGQSQPRISRHLKLMCEAGLLDRYPEGAWVFYRLAAQGGGADLVRHLLAVLPDQDETIRLDQQRLETVRAARETQAQEYFAANAARWDEIRSLQADDRLVEAELLRAVQGRTFEAMVDMGTGTGRMLEVMAPHTRQAIGVDLSRDMLAVARANLQRLGLTHCMVRQGDMTQLPLPAASADLVTVHQVLHYAADPARVIAEAARVLKPGGLLLLVDFAPHTLESLRDQHAHRRLGFDDGEIHAWLRQAGLTPLESLPIPGQTLTVILWRAQRAGE